MRRFVYIWMRLYGGIEGVGRKNGPEGDKGGEELVFVDVN